MPVVVSRINHTAVDRKDGRLKMLTVLFFLLGLVIISRLFVLQIIDHNYYLDRFEKRNDIQQNFLPNRGAIYVRDKGDLYIAVTNRDYYLIFADPRKIQSPSEVVDTLTPILGLSEAEWKALAEKIAKKDDPYEPLKHKVTKEQKEQIERAELPGVYAKPEIFRYYSEKDFGGQIFGFVGYDGNQRIGRYGIEGYFDQELSGIPGYLESFKDASGLPVTIGKRSIVRAVDGSSIVLTIEYSIQVQACRIIKEAVSKYGALSGSMIVMDPKTGVILAMCSHPDFDPEKYNEAQDVAYYNNPAIFNAYEPGSVFKPFTFAAGLDLGVIKPETIYKDTGEIKLIGHKPIKNADLKAHGQQTMVQALEKSLNTGAVFVVEQVGKEAFQKYIKNFGFGKVTGIELQTESSGNISSLEKAGQIYSLTASFGQGITATPLQLITAFAAIPNEGKLMKPLIVDEIRRGDTVIQKNAPQVVSQVIAPKAAALLHGMLVSAVENGWGEKASIPGYYIAGKTGTAQVADKTGKYGQDTIHSFIGYGPSQNPRFIILVRLDSVRAVTHGADSAAPAFAKMAEFLIHFYQIPPER